MNITIERMQEADWEAVQAIYREGLETGNATFETAVPDWQTWDQTHRPDCRLVARGGNGRLLGWAALTPVSGRRVYAGVAEVSIYIAASARNKGIGKTLFQSLITEAEQAGIWTLQASIFPENKASIALHKKYGFREIGYRERVAQLHGVWRNTVLWERRSKVV